MVTVSLSVVNDGEVSEANSVMLVRVNLVGELEVDATVRVETWEETGVSLLLHVIISV